AGALFSPPAPTGLPLAACAAPHLWRTGQSESPRPIWPSPSGLPPLPPTAVRGVLVHENLAVVVRRPGLASVSPTRGGHALSGRRQPREGQGGATASER